MYIDLPKCKRCLCCLPLRHGIIIFGYLNMLFSILVIALDLCLEWGRPASAPTMGIFRGVNLFVEVWMPFVLHGMEIIFNIILIIGTHRKKRRLIQVYYYYGIVTTIATLVILFFVRHLYEFNSFGSTYDIFDYSVGFCGFVIHLYLLLLIRSELMKPRYQDGVTFVNHINEVVTSPPWGEGRNPL